MKKAIQTKNGSVCENAVTEIGEGGGVVALFVVIGSSVFILWLYKLMTSEGLQLKR